MNNLKENVNSCNKSSSFNYRHILNILYNFFFETNEHPMYPDNTLTILSLNVRWFTEPSTVNAPCSDNFIQKASLISELSNLKDEHYSDIICIQETNRFIDPSDELVNKPYTNHKYIGTGRGPGTGVGIFVSPKYIPAISGFKTYYNRIIELKLHLSNNVNIVIINMW
jgi:hypothetical protein